MWFKKILRSNLLIRIRSWEYWPFLLVYWPVFFYWIWYSIKAKSLFYFTASNPGIQNGGMLGESKMDILKTLPEELMPRTVFVEPVLPIEHLLKKIANLSYPVICKPDFGERGRKVEKIDSPMDLVNYHKQVLEPYLIQEFITWKIELGVFYYRYPNRNKGVVSSIVQKEMLEVIGDGKATLEELILDYDRAKLQWETLKRKYKNDLQKVIEKDECKTLVVIGNHSRGTKFLDANHLINPKLTQVFEDISRRIPGFHFGRFDIKTNSVEDLYNGKLKIMELNGAGSEPAHIYDPKHSIFYAYKVILFHWKTLFNISMQNHKQGTPFLSFAEGWSEYKSIRKQQKI